MTTIGMVDVRVMPDLTGFRQKVHAELKALKDVKVGINADLEGFRQKVKTGLAGMKTTVDVDYDRTIGDRLSQGIARAMRREAPSIQRTVRQSVGDGAASALSSALKDAEQHATSIARERLKIDREIEWSRLKIVNYTREMAHIGEKDRAQVAKMQAMYDREVDRRKDLTLEMRARVDQEGRAKADLARLQAQMQAQASSSPIEIPISVDRRQIQRAAAGARSIFTRTMSGIGSMTLWSGVGIGASTAAAGLGAFALQAVPVAAAVSQMASAALLLPAAFGGAAAGLAALIVGSQGLGDALKNMDDAEAWAESLEKLTPSARDFATAVKNDLRPAFKDIQQVTQEGLFAGLGDELRGWTTNLLPALRSGFSSVAAGMNDAARSLMSTLGSPEVSGAIQALMGNVGAGTSAAAPGFGFFTQGFAAMSAAGSAFFERAGSAFSNAGRNFATWVDKIVANGQFDTWVNRSIDAFKLVGSVLGNVGSTLGSIFAATRDSGMNMLRRFDELTAGMATWAGSSAGQAAIDGFFDRVSQVSEALAPVAGSLLGLGGDISGAIAGIATAAAPGIQKIVESLSPAIGVLGGVLEDAAGPLTNFADSIARSIGPALSAIGPGVGDVFRALEASGPAVGRTLESLGRIGGTVLSGIAEVLPTIASALASLSGIVADVVDAIGPLPAALAAFLAALALKGAAGGGGLFGGLKNAMGIGGALLVADAATSGIAESGAEAGSKWAQGFFGGAAAGARLGGGPGAVIGAVLGTGAAFAPEFAEAGRRAFKTFQLAFGGESKPGDMWLNWPAFSLIPDKTKVHGQASYGGTAEEKAASQQRVNDVKKFYSLLEELYKTDYEKASYYNSLRGESHRQTAALLPRIEADAQRARTELEQQGGAARTAANKASVSAMWSDIATFMGASTAESEKFTSGVVSGWSRMSASTSASVAGASASVGASFNAAASSGSAAASSVGAAWGRSAGQSASAVASGAASIGASMWSAAGSGQGAAGATGGAWRSAMGSATSATYGFYSAFNSNAPQNSASRQASGVRSIWASVNVSGIGANIGASLAAGLDSQWSRVSSAASRLANAASSAISMAWRVASPSRVAIEMGGYFGEGLAIGLDKKRTQVGASANTLAKAATGIMPASDSTVAGFGGGVTLLDADGSILARTRVVTNDVVRAKDMADAGAYGRRGL